MSVLEVPSALDVRIDQGLTDIRVPDVRARLLAAVHQALDYLDGDRVDVVVFAARRMLRLYAVLRSLGVAAPATGQVVSDRFLEVLPDGAWSGRRVLLVDDTRLTGLTLQGRVSTLERLVGSSGSFETRVALDAPTPLSTGAERRAWLESETGGDLHAQFSAVFGRNLVPYFTDFAVSRRVPVATSALFDLLTRPGWQVAEVTSSVVSGSGARSFSMFPGDLARARLADALGAARVAVELVKVRVFTRQVSFDTELRIVPVVLTRPFARGPVEHLLHDWSAGGPISDVACEQLTGIATYDLSRTVLDAVAGEFGQVLGVAIAEDTEHRALVLGELDEWIGRVWPWDDLISPDASEVPLGAPTLIDGRSSLLIGDDEVETVIDLFASLAEQHPEDVNRERSSLHSLATRLQIPVADLSVALDLGNDLGTVVPSFLLSADVIYRAYRPGESSDAVEHRGPMGGRYASVEKTVRLDSRFRPTSWSDLQPDDGGPRD